MKSLRLFQIIRSFEVKKIKEEQKMRKHGLLKKLLVIALIAAFGVVINCGDDGGSDFPFIPDSGDNSDSSAICALIFEDPDPSDTTDTDGDGLTDYCECMEYSSDPEKTDTDEDGVNDGDEVVIHHTSPAMADTDGDGMSDSDEISTGGYNPLIAEIPQVELSIWGVPNIGLNIKVTDETGGETETFESELTEESSTYSTSDTTVTHRFSENNFYIDTKLKASTGTWGLFPSASLTVKTGYSTHNTMSKGHTLVVDKSSYQHSQHEYSEARKYYQSREVETISGFIKLGLMVTNPGDKAFTLKNPYITIGKRDAENPSQYKVITTLKIDGIDQDGMGMEPNGGTKGPYVIENNDVSVTEIESLMANPNGLFVELSNFDLVDEDDRDFVFINEETVVKTALVEINYGHVSGMVPERYLVATNVRRNANGKPMGITMKEVMENALQKDYETRELGNDVLYRIGNVEAKNMEEGFWVVILDSERDGRAEMVDDGNFDDIVLEYKDKIYLVYGKDEDSDGVMDIVEHALGTRDDDEDTDDDGLTDFQEIYESWGVSYTGKDDEEHAYAVYSNPLSADIDDDSLLDPDEISALTDPNNWDTDRDSRSDSVDPTPLVWENVPPVADSQSVTTSEDTSVEITLTASDANNDPLGWHYGNPQHGDLSGTTPNLTYTPDPNYSGDDSFTFYVDDGIENSNTATVNIDIEEVADILYVVVGGAGSEDGSSWANAFDHPQDAIDVASDDDQIWIAEGTYWRRSGTDTVLLTMKSNVDIYGGFDGTEESLNDRDYPEDNETILNGHDEVYHVVVGSHNARLDGFTITGGNATGGDSNIRGGGIFSSLKVDITIANCKFEENNAYWGGGMYIGLSSITIENCTFDSNTSTNGGGIYCEDNSNIVTIKNCLLINNSAASQGGGVYNNNSSPKVLNSTFSENSAVYAGGGIFNINSSSPTITDCIMWNDDAGSGDEIYNWNASSDPTVTYSDIDGGYPGEGNINSDPEFCTGSRGGYYLSLHPHQPYTVSPCFDIGSDTALFLGLNDKTTLTNGLYDAGTVDMGYHYER
ncbi:MAG: Ig-like domain-containing protein [Spirochaetota bacterium]|nr:Ig-like domain-containing protein [Spirochaetota bacterium]